MALDRLCNEVELGVMVIAVLPTVRVKVAEELIPWEVGSFTGVDVQCALR